MTNAEPSEASGARLPVDDDVVARALLRWAQATFPGRKFTVVYDEHALTQHTSGEAES